jgi:hypothetical protein
MGALIAGLWQIASNPGSFIICVLALTLLAFVWRVGPKLADRWPDIIRARTERKMALRKQPVPMIIDLAPEPLEAQPAIEGAKHPG